MVDIKLGLPCMVPDLVYKLERFVIRELKLTSRNLMRDGWTDGWGIIITVCTVQDTDLFVTCSKTANNLSLSSFRLDSMSARALRRAASNSRASWSSRCIASLRCL
jgi:hypothetical protein